ncbi:hypothetical protein HDU87_003279 [Geranomyces variabilis]|uniref:Uncharacterized protein n=1 Tax=Geranomyces variabilis TaxID=109894 RepID=A0AAD5TMP2_9FUNG|nr:hypothetical protein HDU87_003279 [Geranomyces variabilis]
MKKLGLIGMSQAVSNESTESLTFITAVNVLSEMLSQTFGSKKSDTDEGAVADASEETKLDAVESVSPLEKARAGLSLVEEQIYWRGFDIQKGPVPKKRRSEINEEKQAKAHDNLVAPKTNASWHAKLQYHLAVTETLPPKDMRSKHANDVLLIDDLTFIGNATMDSDSMIDLMDVDEHGEELEHNILDPMAVDGSAGPSSSGDGEHVNIEGLADSESKEFPTTLLLEGLRKLKDFPELKANKRS